MEFSEKRSDQKSLVATNEAEQYKVNKKQQIRRQKSRSNASTAHPRAANQSRVGLTQS